MFFIWLCRQNFSRGIYDGYRKKLKRDFRRNIRRKQSRRKNYNEITEILSGRNDRGEKITLLGATKYVAMDKITEAYENGLTVIGENHAQEFRDKLPFYLPCEKHFIGTLQKNKLKYVVGKADVIDSVSSVDLANAIDSKAEASGITQKVMLEINAGDESTKTGTPIESAKPLYKSINGKFWR